MDIIREIQNFSTYGYLIDKQIGGYRVLLLGGHSAQKKDNDDTGLGARIARLIDDMMDLYNKETLSEDDEKELVKLYKRMRDLCYFRINGKYTLEEQQKVINELSDYEREQVEKQILMYKKCRDLHAKYYNAI